ncbi:uncharacterized protein LOC142345974 [Convolutriloba macropyga]|uniref:uncharacterized protein LOC142345974 n=1 Tax=Convolutriloba macropyga TaxID=536237 RepID=UPI003F52758A
MRPEPTQFSTRIVLARIFYIIDYVVGPAACFAIIAIIFYSDICSKVAVVVTSIHVILLMIANLCQILAYDTQGAFFPVYLGYSSIIPWIGVLPGFLGAMMTVHINAMNEMSCEVNKNLGQTQM